MKKIIDFNERVEEMKKLSITKKEKEINIRGFKGSITIYLDLPIQNKKSKNFLVSVIKKVLGKSKIDVIEISEEECRIQCIEYFKQISFEKAEELYEDSWNEIKNELIHSVNFLYSVVIGDWGKKNRNATYIASKIFSITVKNQ